MAFPREDVQDQFARAKPCGTVCTTLGRKARTTWSAPSRFPAKRFRRSFDRGEKGFGSRQKLSVG